MKRMSIKEFVDLGYLQEVNRQILHPLGLALEVAEHEDGTCTLSSVWDCRDIGAGLAFHEVDPVKAALVQETVDARRPDREAALGFWIQPLKEDG